VKAVQRDGSIVERDLALKIGTQAFVMRIRPYRTPQNNVDGVVITFVDITERKRTEARQLLLSEELQHRTNNLLAVVQSVAERSLSGDQPLHQAREAFRARLHALANANALLTQSDWKGADLKDLIVRELATFVSRGHDRGAAGAPGPRSDTGLCHRHPRARHQRRQAWRAFDTYRVGCDSLVG